MKPAPVRESTTPVPEQARDAASNLSGKDAFPGGASTPREVMGPDELLEMLRAGNHPHLSWLAAHAGPLAESLEPTYILPLRQALIDELGITGALQLSVLERALASHRLAITADYIVGEAMAGTKVPVATLERLAVIREQADRAYLRSIEYLRFLAGAAAPSLRVVRAAPITGEGVAHRGRRGVHRAGGAPGPIRKVSSGGGRG